MADSFIDQNETQIYGPYAVRQMRKLVRGLLPQFDHAIDFVSEAIQSATKEVALAVGDARTADARWRSGARQKETVIERAWDVLGRFSSHLDGHPRDAVDRKRFFTSDGRMHHLRKRSPRKVLVVLEHIAAELKKRDSGVSDAAGWHREFARAIDGLAPVVEQTESARADRRRMTPEVRQARAEWLQSYGAAKLLIESILRLTGRVDLMPQVFYDLTVPASTRLTAPPPGMRPE
jgi:hypothetical protein